MSKSYTGRRTEVIVGGSPGLPKKEVQRRVSDRINLSDGTGGMNFYRGRLFEIKMGQHKKRCREVG